MAKSQAGLGKNYAFLVDDEWEPGGEPARGNPTASPLNVTSPSSAASPACVGSVFRISL